MKHYSCYGSVLQLCNASFYTERDESIMTLEKSLNDKYNLNLVRVDVIESINKKHHQNSTGSAKTGKPIPSTSNGVSDIKHTNRAHPKTQLKKRFSCCKKPCKSVDNGNKTKKHATHTHSLSKPNPFNASYNGYYDDVPAEDYGRNKDDFDSELINRVAMVAGGVAIFIVLSVFIMTIM